MLAIRAPDSLRELVLAGIWYAQRERDQRYWASKLHKAVRFGEQKLDIAALIVALPGSALAEHWAERDYQQALCAGMLTEFTLPDAGGRAECASETHIIEVDWADKFKEGVGQVLNCAVKSDLIPSLILICRRSEASCQQHSLNAEETLLAVGFEAVIWRCSYDARSLSDRVEVRLAAKP